MYFMKNLHYKDMQYRINQNITGQAAAFPQFFKLETVWIDDVNASHLNSYIQNIKESKAKLRLKKYPYVQNKVKRIGHDINHH